VASNKNRSPIETAAAELRRTALATPDGMLLGSESELLETLGCSRLTIRQAARLLEREGVLRVRRGPSGGYFATRPDPQMVEAIVCSYLDTLGVIPEHSGSVATGLWTQVLREAATVDPAAARALSDRMTTRIEALSDDVSIEEIARLEHETRSAIFELIDGGYIEVLFGINAAFARLHLNRSGDALRPADTAAFLRSWKKAKLLEFEAIATGDADIALLAALNGRKVWQDLDAKPRWTSPPVAGAPSLAAPEQADR
jgi:DNA-binding IscR family transcriptional regulator